jgi:hypothetical protein
MRPCSALPHGVGGMASEADADTGSGVFGVRAQIRRAFGLPGGCFAAKLRSDPKNHAARGFHKCFRHLAQAIRARAAIELVATIRPEPVAESDSDSGLPLLNPCECAEERKPRRIRARDCLSEASSSGTPAGLSTGRCPQRSGGTQTPGSPFLCLLSFGEAKESRSPAAATERLRNSSKNLRPDSTQGFDTSAQTAGKRLRQALPERVRERALNRDRAFSGSEPKFAKPSARPAGATQRNCDLTPKTIGSPAPGKAH